MRSWQPLPKVSIERKPRHPTHRPKPDFSALRNKPAGATLYSVKLAERIERNAFQSLKKRAKEHDGYYSSFTRSFLFDTPEDAEAFRGTAPTSDATRPTSEEQPAIQHPLFDKAALVPVDSYSPKAYNMYRFYSARAREGLGYKKQSIVQNDEARERFIDHIRKLAEQSADAAIRLVVEINKAAEQEEGKPVFPLQHSIYAELEEVHARQTAKNNNRKQPTIPLHRPAQLPNTGRRTNW